MGRLKMSVLAQNVRSIGAKCLHGLKVSATSAQGVCMGSKCQFHRLLMTAWAQSAHCIGTICPHCRFEHMWAFWVNLADILHQHGNLVSAQWTLNYRVGQVSAALEPNVRISAKCPVDPSNIPV